MTTRRSFMVKTYTKKQIEEAIKFWESKINEMSSSGPRNI